MSDTDVQITFGADTSALSAAFGTVAQSLQALSGGAIGRDLSVDDLAQRLTPAEMPGLTPFMNALMVEIGLAGEPTPSMEAASPSTAISTPSSPNSSPADAATGT